MNLKTISIFSAGLILGIVAILYTNLGQIKGSVQVSEAQVLPTPTPVKDLPMVCNGCSFDTNFGNRWAGKDAKKAYLPNLSIAGPADFTNTDFKGAYLPNLTASQVTFIGADFSNTIMTSANFCSACDLTNTNFSGADLSDSNGIGSGNFTGANFTGANLSGSTGGINSNNFTNANFTGANISLANNMSGNNFTGANFTNANFLGIPGYDYSNNTFTSVVWSNTICPDGTNSNSDGNTCIGHLLHS